jgi:gliding motility-associated-like protein
MQDGLNINSMKIIPYILLFFLFFSSLSLISQTAPTVTVTSSDAAFCESGNATLEITFTGDAPFSYMVQIGDGSYEIGGDNIYDYNYERSFSVDESCDISVLRVYDSNYTYDSSDPLGSGVEVTDQSMSVVVYDMPEPNAGVDDDPCGLEYTLSATVTDASHDIWWSDMSTLGSFDDDSSPTATFTSNAEGTLTFTLNEKNGTCEASDDVIIEFKGSPTATITNTEDFEFCSTDGLEDQVSIDVTFTGNAPFDYVVQNNTDTYSLSTSDLNETIEYAVSYSDNYSITSLTDSNGCAAYEDDITGSKIVTDLKPSTFAGDDDLNCGTEYALQATLSEGTTGVWSTSASGVVFADSGLETTTVSSSSYQYATLTWTETDDDMGCVNSDEVIIHFAESPTLSISEASDQICEGSSTYMEYTVTGNSPWTLNYNNGAGSLTESDINSSNNTLVLVPTYNQVDDIQSLTEYNFTSVVGGYGCETTYSDLVYSVYVDEMPVANAGIDDEVCSTEVVLDATPSIGDGQWSVATEGAGGEFADETDPYTTFLANSFGEIGLKWTEVNGTCSSSDEIAVVFQESPYPVYAGEDSIIYARDNISLYASDFDYDLYLEDYQPIGTWSLLEGSATIEDVNQYNTRVTNLQEGLYSFLWTATIENSDCASIADTVNITVKNIFAPTGFSPNGDELNETFEILGASNITNNKLSVFDRYGKLVFSTTDYNNDWRGTNLGGSDLPEGTYYYVFEGDELSKPIKKYLILKR